MSASQRDVAPITSAPETSIKFLMLDCPSRLGTKGKLLNAFRSPRLPNPETASAHPDESGERPAQQLILTTSIDLEAVVVSHR